MARELSLGKARTAAQKHRDALIIAADTLVVLGDRILGKPHTNVRGPGNAARLEWQDTLGGHWIHHPRYRDRQGR